MNLPTPAQYLQNKPYPGRGILLGRSSTGMLAYMAYFIMGRSENSRNRVFTQTENGIITEAANPAKVQDPSLIIYTPVRKIGTSTVVTNGDQTDTLSAALENEQGLNSALRSRTFEPDAPNFTPRISGILTNSWEGFAYKLSILKSAQGNPDSVQRFFYEYPQPLAGQGHLIHTYQQDGNPLPSFEGEPRTLALNGTLQELGDSIWQALDEENKVSLFVCSQTLDGTTESIIYNKYTKI